MTAGDFLFIFCFVLPTKDFMRVLRFSTGWPKHIIAWCHNPADHDIRTLYCMSLCRHLAR